MRLHSQLLNQMWERVRTPFTQPSPDTKAHSSSAQELVARIGPWMNELREDLSTPEGRYLREFYVLPSRTMRLVTTQPHLAYSEEAYPEIREHLAELEQAGLVSSIMRLSDNVRVYRISQELFNILMST